MLSNLIEILILSLVQGITEFLPISSSAHLNIIGIIFEYESNSLMINVSLHLGSLLAIIFFFRKELLDLQKNQRLLSLIIIGSIPIIIAGYILYTTNLIYLLKDNIEIIAWTTLIFGIILFFADKNRFNKKISSSLNLKTILYIGLFQVLALIPGVSRAGITMTAARIFKFNRVDSGKISFLMAIPALTAASVLSLKDIFKQSFEINYLVFLAIILSFIFSFFTVKFFLNYINKFSLNIFVIYRIIIAIILFKIIYF
jgi:undecaprenyl-diphosphatase